MITGFTRWREHRRLRKQAEQETAGARSRWSAELNAPYSGDEPNPRLSEFHRETAGPQSVLRWIDDFPLIRAAEKYGVEIEPGWWITSDLEPGIQRPYLQEFCRPKLRRLVNEARRESVQTWMSILIPPVGLLVAFASLVKEILIAWLKK